MTNSRAINNLVSTIEISDLAQVVATFQQSVINRFQMGIGNTISNYQEYLTKPVFDRSNDEADAVDQQFARYVLEWLGFTPSEWNYNRPQAGQKANRPDYIVKSSLGTAFIWEDKNSTFELAEDHLAQMRRYCTGTAGYSVWCNMRRIFAVRFIFSDTLKYEILADISIEALYGSQPPSPTDWEIQATNLALFRLLFSKERFTQFTQLIYRIAIDEEAFKSQAIPLTHLQTMQSFIDESRQSLDHLRLAALSQIRKSVEHHEISAEEEKALQQEWDRISDEFITKLGYDAIRRKPVLEAIERLTPRLGEITMHEIDIVKEDVEKAEGTKKLSASVTVSFEKWRERAARINSAILTRRFESTETFRIAYAYRVWSERQSDQRDVKPEVFAEQVAYVFFIRLLLVRVLEDKGIISPRLASDGGFDAWKTYIHERFQELSGVRILNENLSSLLTLKAENYYLHFFQQAVFDWFTPDDFLFVETLEFLCRYNFQQIASDIIGFTYEEYIDRTARNRKGHFLTRAEVVEYMLDLLEYDGPQVLERRIFDPACGSGSFLVHAAHRYRRALVNALCNQYNLPDEDALTANSALRLELARRYLDDLTKLFFGMELNPFACYLAEMNLLIQGLDDLSLLQAAGEAHPIERFQIYNTDSLDLPREVLESTDITGGVVGVPDRLSDRIVDEASPLKGKLGKYAEGFFFIISNPPYINASQVALKKAYSVYPFYAQVLSGATNTYLLFLRLGMYYLGAGGRMMYLVPLTILGDAAAGSARKLLMHPPFRPMRITRFFSGNVLFPGVDQAVAMIRVDRDASWEPGSSFPEWEVRVSGGYTVQEARQGESAQSASLVLNSTPSTEEWQAVWLVSSEAGSYDVWKHVRTNAKSTLGQLWEDLLELRQGDVRSDHVHSFRLGRNHRPIQGDIAIQKGEDVFRYAPLARKPSDWARPKAGDIRDTRLKAVNDTLLRIQQLQEAEQGITLRKIARLNTREILTATWFRRDKTNLFIFPDEQWRFRLLPGGDVTVAKGLLALLNSRTIAYLLNLFSTNNNVAQADLVRLLIPDPTTFPASELAGLADELLQERANIENDFVLKYQGKLPEFDDDAVYVPPSGVLAATTQIMKLSLGGLIRQGMVRNRGDANHRIVSLRTRGLIEYLGSDAAYAQLLDLFLREPGREDETWTQAQNWQLPDPVAASSWLRIYSTIGEQAQASWDKFVALQRHADDVVWNWYGFDPEMRAAIVQGLPWARRRRNG